MKITFLWKDRDSGGGNCPALYKTEEPAGYVAQGKQLNGEARVQLRDVAADEDGVWLPANVIDRLVDERLKELGLA